MLILKILLAPALIGLATWIGHRWGPVVGGWSAALPLTSGPVVLFLAIERGPDFAAHASRGTLLGLAALAAYAVAYGRAARTLPWIGSSLIACATYLACAWLLRDAEVPLMAAFAIACAALLVAIQLLPRDRAPDRRPTRRAWDIPLRMALAAALVLLLTAMAGTWGPLMSGLLTPFPIAATLLAAFTQHFEGPGAARDLLRGLLIGLFSFALFFLTVGTVIVRWGVPTAFATATLAAFACHAVAWRWARR